MKKRLSSNMEMYLKTILRLERRGGPVRVKAIADSLGVTMPSVSEALRNLKTRGLVDHASYGVVTLSADGRLVAAEVNKRFELLHRFLTDMLHLEDHIAEKEACEIEHVVGEDTFERLTAFLDWLAQHGEEIAECIEKFHEFLGTLLSADDDGASELPPDPSSTQFDDSPTKP